MSGSGLHLQWVEVAHSRDEAIEGGTLENAPRPKRPSHAWRADMPRLTRLQKALWALVAVAAVGASGLILWLDYRAPTPVQTGEADIRADFRLTDQAGTERTPEDFRGRWLLILFGFTHCPDICPTGLATMAEVMDGLGGDAAAVQPLFVTVDPLRDTPEVLAEFVPAFHPSILGLTGSPEAVKSATDAFRIFAERLEDAAAPDGYTMEHSAPMYLFDPQGRFVRPFSYGTPADEIVADIESRT